MLPPEPDECPLAGGGAPVSGGEAAAGPAVAGSGRTSMEHQIINVLRITDFLLLPQDYAWEG